MDTRRAVVVTAIGLVVAWWLAGHVVFGLVVDRLDCQDGWRCLGERDALGSLLLGALLLTVADHAPHAAVVAAGLLALGALVRPRAPYLGGLLVTVPAVVAGLAVLAVAAAGIAIVVA